MTHKPKNGETEATCHCGKISIILSVAPTAVTKCNCSLCRRLGVIWAYCSEKELTFLPEPSLTDTYAWNGKHVDFHRCRQCGCLTHWIPRDADREKRGINARLLPPQMLARAKVRHLDGADTGKYLD